MIICRIKSDLGERSDTQFKIVLARFDGVNGWRSYLCTVILTFN